MIDCPACGASLAERDIDFDRRLGTCGHCRALIDLKDRLPPAAAGEEDRRRRGPVPMPASVTAVATPHGPALRYRWFQPACLFFLAFSVVWLAMVVGIFGTGLAIGADAPAEMGAPLRWFNFAWIVMGAFFLCIGLGGVVLSVAGLVNGTTLLVERDRLSVRHGPIPWLGNAQFPRDELEQLYCRRKTVPHAGSDGHGPSASTSYSLNAVTRDGRSHLLTSSPDPETVLYLEQRLEQELGIRDKPVAGEMAP